VPEYVLGAESGGVVAVLGRGTFAEELDKVGTPSSSYDAGVYGYSFSTNAEDVHV
jgi:hypothetical protein